MKQSEFVRWLRAQGATFRQLHGHMLVELNGRRTVLPRHPAKELKTGTLERAKKDLGLK